MEKMYLYDSTVFPLINKVFIKDRLTETRPGKRTLKSSGHV